VARLVLSLRDKSGYANTIAVESVSVFVLTDWGSNSPI
jgi:hypothetical protein